METILDAAAIQKIIPHRYPMLLIDKVVELETGKRAVAIRNVTIHEATFQGHFPGNPVLPGVSLIESMAQTGAVALLSEDQFKGKTAYFGGIKDAKFRRIVKPGDQVRLEVSLEKIKGPVGLAKGSATVDGKKAATAELTFIIS